MTNQIKKRPVSTDVLIALLVFVITFPKFVPELGPGLDLSYTWALNYLFAHDYTSLTGLTYPVGPLGFLKYVASYQNHLLIGLLFFSGLKLLFLFLLVRSNTITGGRYPLVFGIVLIAAAYFAGIDFSIIGSVILLMLLFLRFPSNYFYFLAACPLACLGLFIKSSIGISALSSIGTFIIYAGCAKSLTIRKILTLSIIGLLIFVVSGMIVFRGIAPFYQFIVGVFHLAGGYSSGLALHPENNWWLLSGYLLSMVAIPVVLKDKTSKFVFILFLLPLFAVWKHAMGREDIYHAQQLIGFTAIVWAVLFSVMKKHTTWHFILPVAGIGLFYLNLINLPLNDQFRVNTAGFANFNEAVLNFPRLDKKSKDISENALKTNLLPEKIKNEIGHRSVDIYPWELSYVPANELNWSPRKTLELGASTSAWLSHKAASHFSGDKAPEFVIFHLVTDRWYNGFGSLDGRFILNDEPNLIFNLMNNYELSTTGEGLLLFRKTFRKNKLETKPGDQFNASWNNWVKVPEAGNDVIRAKTSISNSWAGELKKFFYKDEAYYIDYLLENGNIVTYRFLPSNAVDGLWVSPMVYDPSFPVSTQTVDSIRFRCTNLQMVRQKLKVQFETITSGKFPAAPYFFGQFPHKEVDTMVSFQNPEQTEVLPGSYSHSFEIDLDSIVREKPQKLIAEVTINYSGVSRQKAMLICSLEDTDAGFWTPFRFSVIADTKWNYAIIRKVLNLAETPSGKLKFYVWNNGAEAVSTRDFRVTLYRYK